VRRPGLGTLVSTMRCTRGVRQAPVLFVRWGLRGLHMVSLLNRSGRQAFGPLIQKLRSLGVDSDTELDAVLNCIKVRAGTRRGEDIIAAGGSPRHSTLLLEGVACLYERLQDGNRQIYAFQYPSDFCDLHRHALPETNNEVAVAAITDCSIGIIEHKDLEQLIAQYPSLGLALWRATMLEASIFRKRLLNVGRQPALQRVAHLLCEQLARREAVGIDSATIPLTQMDLADAAGLSIVHVNRTFKELRRLNVLSKEGRTIKVVDRERLAGLASFDGNYLNMPQLLSHWQVKIERASAQLGFQAKDSRTFRQNRSELYPLDDCNGPALDALVTVGLRSPSG